jgi:hypothetical protein
MLLVTAVVAAAVGFAVNCTCAERVQAESREAACEAYCQHEEGCFPGEGPDEATNPFDLAGCREWCIDNPSWGSTDQCDDTFRAHMACVQELSCEGRLRMLTTVDDTRPCKASLQASTSCRND